MGFDSVTVALYGKDSVEPFLSFEDALTSNEVFRFSNKKIRDQLYKKVLEVLKVGTILKTTVCCRATKASILKKLENRSK